MSIIWYHLYVESKNWYKWNYLPNRNGVIEVEKKNIVTKGEGRVRDVLGYGINIYALLYTK